MYNVSIILTNDLDRSDSVSIIFAEKIQKNIWSEEFIQWHTLSSTHII